MAKDKDKESVEHGLIRELAELLDEKGLSEIEIERNGLKIRVARQIAVQATAMTMPQPASLRGAVPSAHHAAAAPAGPE